MSSKDFNKKLDSLEKQLCQQLRDLERRYESLAGTQPVDKDGSNTAVADLGNDIAEFTSSFKQELQGLRQELQALQETVSIQGERVDEMEQYSRRNCLLVHGVKETPGENTTDLVLNIVNSKLNLNLESADIDRSHRIGRPKRAVADVVREGTRPVIVKFVTYQQRQQVFRAKRALKNTPILITESLTVERQRLLRDAKDRFGAKQCWTYDGKIVILRENGRKEYISTSRELKQLK